MSGITDDDLRWLLELLDREGLAEIEVRDGETDVLVSRAVAAPVGLPALSLPYEAAPAPVAEGPAPLPENHLPVLSPMAGVFYRSPSPETASFVQPGDHLEHGDTLGLVEAMKLFNEVPAPASGTLLAFLVENGQTVDADQPIALLEIPSTH